MGGKAAKERRRLERLEKQGDAGRASQAAKEQKYSSTKRSEPNSFRKADRTGGVTSPHRLTFVPKSRNGLKPLVCTSKKTLKEPKQKAFKKPKHLKRKLEETKDDVAKQTLLTELQKLEEHKKLFSIDRPRKKLKTDEGFNSKSKERKVTANQGLVRKIDNQSERDVTSTKRVTYHKMNEANEHKVSPYPIKHLIASKTCDTPSLLKEPAPVEVPENSVATTFSPSGPVTAKKEVLVETTFSPSGSVTAKKDVLEENHVSHNTEGNWSQKDEKKNVSTIDDDSDTSDDDVNDDHNKRQRGRRRRGRVDSDKHIAESVDERLAKGEDKEIAYEAVEVKVDKPQSKDTARRCKGRKPLTDFKIGQRYPGEVVYIKPFGVFIDINCHSEVFCHVSRVQDGFVETPEDILKIGDQVNPRIVEIDRKNKRITVSLQSDQRIADEKASADAHFERASKRRLNRPKATSSSHDPSNDDEEMGLVEENELDKSDVGSFVNDLVDGEGNFLKDEKEMTPAEFKRAKKLARRAQRRMQHLETGILT